MTSTQAHAAAQTHTSCAANHLRQQLHYTARLVHRTVMHRTGAVQYGTVQCTCPNSTSKRPIMVDFPASTCPTTTIFMRGLPSASCMHYHLSGWFLLLPLPELPTLPSVPAQSYYFEVFEPSEPSPRTWPMSPSWLNRYRSVL
jgi:hypothetical protein